MERSLYDIYMNNPGNYVAAGLGGSGKTTQLLNIVKSMLFDGKNVSNGVTYIPIYIQLKSLNIREIKPGIIYDLISDYFNKNISEKAINEMFEQTIDDYRYIILLDGFNELKNYLTRFEQTVYHCVLNDIRKLDKNENVDFVISLRDANIIDFDEIFVNYKLLQVGGLSKHQVDEYLGRNIFDLESHLLEILSIPMMARIFAEVYAKENEKAIELNTKYDLLKNWLSLDTVLKKNEFSDIDDYYRERALYDVLPLFALKVQLQVLNDNIYERGLNQDELLEEAFNILDIVGVEKQQITKAIKRMTLLIGENLLFAHDLIREYLATYCIINHVDMILNNDVKLVFERLTYFLDENKHPLSTSIGYIDFAELIYGAAENKNAERDLISLLQKKGYENDEAIYKSFEFYYRLAGIYELLNNRRMAYFVGWRAIELLPKVLDRFNTFEKAQKFNFLYYCVNSFKEETVKDPFFLIEKAKALIEEVEVEKRPDNYCRVYSWILANTGAYYVSPYVNEPLIAKEWHLKCLEYRKNNNLDDAIAGSYGTLMTDCYYLALKGEIPQGFRQAYYIYRAILKRLTRCHRLSKAKDISVVKAELVVRALGNEVNILLDDKTPPRLKDEIREELIPQINHIYDKATKGRRHNFSVLNDLYNRINELLSWEELYLYPELESVLKEYLEKKI